MDSLWYTGLLWGILILCGNQILLTSAQNSSESESSSESGITTTVKSLELNDTSALTPVVRNKSSVSFLPLPESYNKLEIPLRSDKFPVFVFVSLFIRSILDIDTKQGEITLDVDLGISWVDWKIFEFFQVHAFIDPITNKPIGNRTLDAEALDVIWKPDIFIDEMASMKNTALLGKLTQLSFLGEQGKGGQIVLYTRTTLKLRCGMEFQYYPADTQTCEYYIRSYTHREKEMQLFWSIYNAIDKPNGIFLNEPSDPNFNVQLESVEPNPVDPVEEVVIFERFERYRGGAYSSLKFTLKARRKITYHLVQTYLPSVLLILITWLCFLLPVNMVEARIGISMTTVLTLTAMFASVREQSPEVSYTMGIDIWMVFCIFFVFIALLLFTAVYWIKRQNEAKIEALDAAKNMGNSFVDEEAESKRRTYEMIVKFTKRYAFFTFALTFILFVTVYWSWLMFSSHYLRWNPNPLLNRILTDDDEASDSSNLYEPVIRSRKYLTVADFIGTPNTTAT